MFFLMYLFNNIILIFFPNFFQLINLTNITITKTLFVINTIFNKKKDLKKRSLTL